MWSLRKAEKGVAAKDIILEVLRRMSVKGGVGKVIEYTGEGGYTYSAGSGDDHKYGSGAWGDDVRIPSDEATRQFLKAQNREEDFKPISADSDAVYDEHIVIDLSDLEPMAACPHSPGCGQNDRGTQGGKKIDQVCIGSRTNLVLYRYDEGGENPARQQRGGKCQSGRRARPKQVLNMIAKNGALADMIAAGARILECACGPLHRHGTVA